MNSFRRFSEMFTVAVFVFASMLTVHGQVTTGSIRGSVLDPQSAAVQNAKVTITRKSTKTTATTQTNDSGQFEFNNLALADDTKY